MRRISKSLCMPTLLVLLLIARAGWSAETDRAEKIIEELGISGGLILHLGCGDGRLTAELGRSGRFVVRGLDVDAKTIDAARRHIREQKLYGRTSVGTWDGKHIPCMDNLVNLIVSEKPLGPSEKEILRALAPRGVALIAGRKIVKPWPGDIDEWTHYLHGPDNNAVAKDRVVGPPERLQWLAEPVHLRSHEHLNSVSALVSTRGRIFYIIDEGSTAAVVAPPKWRLVARDAFNGILLWKRDLGRWEGHFRLFRSGPPALARRLVAVGQRVYATLGYGKPVTALDAATGKTVHRYDGTEGALEIVCDKDRLFVVTGSMDLDPPAEPAKRYYPPPAPRDKGIVAVDAESGEVLWKRKDKDTAELMPEAMAVSDGRVFFQNTRQVICLDAAGGEEQWRADRPVYTKRLSWSSSILVARDGVVLSADGSTGGVKRQNMVRGEDKVQWTLSDTDIRTHPAGDLLAFSAKDGKKLWTGKSLQGFCNPGDLFVINGLVWAGANVAPRQMALDTACDLHTGEIKSRRTGRPSPAGGHTRCYRDKATDRFLVLGGAGVEFVDVGDWKWQANPWVRGTCQYGVMPCNGLLYVPPDSCACRPDMRLHGFTAMAPERSADTAAVEPPAQLKRGPAYAAVQDAEAPRQKAATDAWPTYRGDCARSGRTTSAVPARLKQAWRTEIGGRLTSPTVAAGRVFVSRVDAHTVYALDAGSGRTAWHRTVGGSVDSPPTVHAGLVIFGCRDGHVYCLRAGDGELVWRFRASPEDKFLVAMDGVESAWPVHGSVLVRDGKVWFTAGRSPFLDGGIRLHVLEAASGKQILTKTLNSREDAEGGRTPPMMPDILSASGELAYMRWMGFDAEGNTSKEVKPHLFGATGFLDDTWWHRTYWQHGTWMSGGFGGWPGAARRGPAGRIIVLGDTDMFGFGRTKYDAGNGGDVHAGHVGLVKQDYRDMGLLDYPRNPYRLFSAKKPAASRKKKSREVYNWSVSVPLLVRAMLLAEETLFVAGPPADARHGSLSELGSDRPGILQAVSTADGKKLSQLGLESTPIFDGMAAAGGRLVISLADGSVVCLAGTSD